MNPCSDPFVHVAVNRHKYGEHTWNMKLAMAMHDGKPMLAICDNETCTIDIWDLEGKKKVQFGTEPCMKIQAIAFIQHEGKLCLAKVIHDNILNFIDCETGQAILGSSHFIGTIMRLSADPASNSVIALTRASGDCEKDENRVYKVSGDKVECLLAMPAKQFIPHLQTSQLAIDEMCVGNDGSIYIVNTASAEPLHRFVACKKLIDEFWASQAKPDITSPSATPAALVTDRGDEKANAH